MTGIDKTTFEQTSENMELRLAMVINHSEKYDGNSRFIHITVREKRLLEWALRKMEIDAEIILE